MTYSTEQNIKNKINKVIHINFEEFGDEKKWIIFEDEKNPFINKEIPESGKNSTKILFTNSITTGILETVITFLFFSFIPHKNNKTTNISINKVCFIPMKEPIKP